MALTYDTKGRIPVTALTTTTSAGTAAFTCGANAEVLSIMVCYAGTVARTGGAPTYNSVALTQAETRKGVTEASVESWYFLAPPVGAAYNINIPNAGGLTMWAYVASGNAGATSGCAYDSSGTAATTGGTPTVSLSTGAAGCLIFAVVASGDNTFAPTAQTGSALYQEDVGAYGAAAQYYVKAGTGAQVMSWTEATSDDYGAIAVAFKEVAVSSGTAIMTMAAFTLSASGSVVASAILGTLDATLASFAVSGSGASIIAGSLDKTLTGCTLSATAQTTALGSLVKTLDGATLTATGTISNAAATAELNVTLDGFAVASTVQTTIAANLDKTLAGCVLSADGSVAFGAPVIGELIATLAGAVLSASGNTLITGALDKTLAGFTLSGAGFIPAVGTSTNTLDNFTLAADGSVGSLVSTGTLNAILANATLISSGTSIITGVASNTAGNFTLDATGTQEATAQLSATLGNAILTASGGENVVTLAQVIVTLAGAYMASVGTVWKPYKKNPRRMKLPVPIGRNNIIYRSRR